MACKKCLLVMIMSYTCWAEHGKVQFGLVGFSLHSLVFFFLLENENKNLNTNCNKNVYLQLVIVIRPSFFHRDLITVSVNC